MKTIELTYEVDDEIIRKSYFNVDETNYESKVALLQALFEATELFARIPSNQQKAFYIQNTLKGFADDSEYKIMLVSDLVYYDYDNYENPTKPHTIEEALSVLEKLLSDDPNVDPEESLIVYVNKNKEGK